MQCLVPTASDTLLSAMYLQCLPEPLRNILMKRGHLTPLQLAEAAQAMYNSYLAAVVPRHVHLGGVWPVTCPMFPLHRLFLLPPRLLGLAARSAKNVLA